MSVHDSRQRIAAIQAELLALAQALEEMEQENSRLTAQSQAMSRLRDDLATRIAQQFARDVVRGAGADLRKLNTAYADTRLYLSPLFEDQGADWLATLEREFDKAMRIEALRVPQLKLWAPALAVQEVDTVAAPSTSPLAAVKILFLAANPVDAPHLGLDEEIRAIQHSLREAEHRDQFTVVQEWAVRRNDLTGALLRHRPHVVHFSGHGTQSGELVLKDDAGRSRPVSILFLSQLFSTLRDNIRLVVLNACYSERQARKIAELVDCVVGMPQAIGDEAARDFSAAFYQALGYGRSVREAFDLGSAQVDLDALAEQDRPLLLGAHPDCAQVVLV